MAQQYLASLEFDGPLYRASVVLSQSQFWQACTPFPAMTLGQIPLANLYKTLGIDRALAALGAGLTYSFPCLVIDSGTALTLTALDAQQRFWGGAILPGLGLQFQCLAQKTAALPALALPSELPPRWAQDTETAITSGILYTLLAGLGDFIRDWQASFPQGPILLTGGDAPMLQRYGRQQNPAEWAQVFIDPHLAFWGLRHLVLSM
ncbi:accessory factor Bvg [Synechocystis sp. LKSZ1]